MTDTRLLDALAADPDKVLSLMERLNSHIVVPHDAQRPVVESNARFKVLNCGRRWGKTKIGAKMMLDAAREKPNSMNWWVAPTYRIVKRGYREVLRQLPRDFLTHDPQPDSNFDAGRPVVLRLKNGANIEFYSAERPAGMLGEGVDFVVQDEAAKTPSLVWDQVISPTLIDREGSGVLISTPEGRNWFYKRWLAGQDPDDPTWASWTFPTWTNPHLPAGEIERMRRDLPALIFAQEVEAKFLAAGSSVFRWPEKAVEQNAIYDNGLVEDCPPTGQVFLGVDLAKTTDYTVFYGAREDGHNVYYERLNMVSWPEQKRRLARAVRTLRTAGAENVTLIMDSTGVGDPIQEDMEALGYDVIPINFTSMKNKMVVLLAKDLEEGKARILEDGQVTEFENYAMGMTPGGRITYGAPQGEHDDVVSAKMLQHHGLVNEGAPNLTALSADDEYDSGPRNPDEEDDALDAGEDWSDLVDDVDVGEVQESLGLLDLVRPGAQRVPARTPEELLNDPDVWT